MGTYYDAIWGAIRGKELKTFKFKDYAKLSLVVQDKAQLFKGLRKIGKDRILAWNSKEFLSKSHGINAKGLISYMNLNKEK